MVTDEMEATATATATGSASAPPSPSAALPLSLPPSPSSHHRRPRARARARVREVSSRFMSPTPHRRQPDPLPLATADDNINPPIPNNINNSQTPFPKPNSITATATATVTTLRKHRSPKLFKDKENTNSGGGGFTTPSTSRPDTPTITVSSRYRLTHHHHHHHRHRSINSSAAAKLLQTSGISFPSQHQAGSVPDDTSSICSESDDDLGDSGVSCSILSLPELCCSMQDPTVSLSTSTSTSTTTRSVADKIGNRSSVSTSVDLKLPPPCSPFCRSLNLPSSSGSEKQLPSLSKSVKVGGGLSLPPVPPTAKPLVTEARKGKKGSSHQEDVHSLRMLHNRYLLWRYANAKAASSMEAQQTQTEKALYSHAMKISELRNSVYWKRIELGLLQRSKTLSTILEAQIPYLDEWSTLQEDYSVSLSEAAQALSNAAVQLPIGVNVKVEVREVGEALNSALKLMETIDFHIRRFMPKMRQMAEETDNSISELARLAGGERVSIAECGDLLSKLYKSQVEECSLRGQLIQLHSICQKDNTKE